MAAESEQIRTAALPNGASNFEASARSASAASDLILSPSVRKARDRFPVDEPIAGVVFVEAILDQSDHRTKYAAGKASDLTLVAPSGVPNEQLPDHWLEEVRTLYDESRATKLHGRLVILGLSLLDADLQRQLRQNGFLAALEQEVTPPLDELLSVRGRALRAAPEAVPNHPDHPVQRMAEDQLGRAAYARFLAGRLRTLPDMEQAFVFHIYGPWGAGKSTLLNFLREELEQPDKQGWCIVEFNAWQHQHIQPPWWALLDRVFQQVKPRLSWDHRLREYWWRLSSGRLPTLIGLVLLIWIVVVAVSMFRTYVVNNAGDGTTPMEAWAAIAQSIGTILAVIVTIWAGVHALSRSLLLNSAQAAKSYVETVSNPMNVLTDRFETLIKEVQAERMAIFIDDLDRCQCTYAVELLEGIQTLFRQAPVVFVVAADQRWLHACFEQVYNDLSSHVGRPGRPLGTLFLEKIFQFATPVPGIPPPLRQAYWRYLLTSEPNETVAELERARAQAREEMGRKRNEREMMDVLRASHDLPFAQQQAMREAAVERMASPTVQSHLEHSLEKYVHLLEPNPRGMKRLVNAYSVNRNISTLGHLDIEEGPLALWTILSMRWPVLADYLEKDPYLLKQTKPVNATAEIQELWQNIEIQQVIGGEGTDAALEVEIVEQCSLLRS